MVVVSARISCCPCLAYWLCRHKDGTGQGPVSTTMPVASELVSSTASRLSPAFPATLDPDCLCKLPGTTQPSATLPWRRCGSWQTLPSTPALAHTGGLGDIREMTLFDGYTSQGNRAGEVRGMLHSELTQATEPAEKKRKRMLKEENEPTRDSVTLSQRLVLSATWARAHAHLRSVHEPGATEPGS